MATTGINGKALHRDPGPLPTGISTASIARAHGFPLATNCRGSYLQVMSLRCLFGVHRPLLASIVRRKEGYAALCDGCSLPIERRAEGPWKAAGPLQLAPRANQS